MFYASAAILLLGSAVCLENQERHNRLQFDASQLPTFNQQNRLQSPYVYETASRPQDSYFHYSPLTYRAQEIYHGLSFAQPAAAYQWGPWGVWSTCSKSCDGGAQMRIRDCKSIYNEVGASFQHPQCSGPHQDYRACNAQECLSPKDLKKRKYSVRVRQCAKFNDRPYLGQMFTWVPYMRVGLDECKLNCLAEGFRMFTTFEDGLEAGTICGEEAGMQCRDGKCLKVENEITSGKASQEAVTQQHPIQGILQFPFNQFPATERQLINHQLPLHQSNPSNQVSFASLSGDSRHFVTRYSPETAFRSNPNIPPDSIDIGQQVGAAETGRNKMQQLILVQKTFEDERNMKLGYNPAFRIPAGAQEVYIDEKTPSRNYLALRIGGKDIINGQWVIDRSKNLSDAGTIIEYTILDGGKSKERIYAKGPLTQDLEVLLLFQKDVVDISYNYSIPARLTSVNLYPQQIVPIRRSSSMNQVYQSFEHDRQAPWLGVDIGNSGPERNLPGPQHGMGLLTESQRPSPGRQASVESQTTVYQWQVGGISECSVQCGGGEQQFIYRCFAVVGLTTGNFVEESHCTHLGQPPVQKRVCNLEPCPARWEASAWSECSKTCGTHSIQQRTVECKETHDIEGKRVELQVPVNKCQHIPKPAESQECNYIPCFFKWKTGIWGQCSRLCGQGMRYREVYCEHTNRFKIPDINCDADTKPLDSMACFEKECNTTWFASEWSPCSSACGSGTQYRHVLCTSSSGGLVAEQQCSGEERPQTTRSCTGTFCKEGVWTTSDWTQCSRFCGIGVQTREVFCMAGLNESHALIEEERCDSSRKPVAERRCHITACPPLWYAGTWSACTVTCGGGYQFRQRTCLMENGSPARGCQYSSRPHTNQTCSTNECPVGGSQISYTTVKAHALGRETLEIADSVEAPLTGSTVLSQAEREQKAQMSLPAHAASEAKSKQADLKEKAPSVQVALPMFPSHHPKEQKLEQSLKANDTKEAALSKNADEKATRGPVTLPPAPLGRSSTATDAQQATLTQANLPGQAPAGQAALQIFPSHHPKDQKLERSLTAGATKEVALSKNEDEKATSGPATLPPAINNLTREQLVERPLTANAASEKAPKKPEFSKDTETRSLHSSHWLNESKEVLPSTPLSSTPRPGEHGNAADSRFGPNEHSRPTLQPSTPFSTRPFTKEKSLDPPQLQARYVDALKHLQALGNSTESCVDKSSAAYCHVVAVKLKFCNVPRFKQSCCRTCQDGAKG